MLMVCDVKAVICPFYWGIAFQKVDDNGFYSKFATQEKLVES